VRTFVWVIGLLAILIALSASGTLTGSVCLGSVGCLNSGAGSVSITRTTPPTGTGAPAPAVRLARRA
jgi:hypothetical protein